MARWISAKKLAIKWKKKETKRVKKLNKQMIAVDRRMQKMVDDFLVSAETENSDPEAAKIWTEIAMGQVIEGLNDLNLEGNNGGRAAADSNRN
ncbi:hypothetical protein PTKIN_Ptkin18bG0151700 [Pterospermum kingtungense]